MSAKMRVDPYNDNRNRLMWSSLQAWGTYDGG